MSPLSADRVQQETRNAPDCITQQTFDAQKISGQIRPVVIISVNNNEATVIPIINSIKKNGYEIIVVNDGSTDTTSQRCSAIGGITLIHHEVNRGKGAALRSGFQKAKELDYTHAITIDGNGQYLPDEITLFAEKIREEPGTLWVGNRIIPVGADVQQQPLFSRFGRYFGAFWYRLLTGTFIYDIQCGFRAYPIDRVVTLGCDRNRSEYEIEVLICAAWNRIPVKSLPVHLQCEPKRERIGHLRHVDDFIRISVVNVRAVITRLFFPPQLINVPGLRIRKKIIYVFNKELRTNATPHKAALSLAVGVTLAVSPFHGIQVIILLALAFLLKLNRPLALLGVSVSSAPVVPFWIAAGLWLGRSIVPLESAISMAAIVESMLPGSVLSFIQNKTISGFLHSCIQWFIGTLVLSPTCGVLTFALSWPWFKMLERSRRKRQLFLAKQGYSYKIEYRELE